MMLAHAKAVLAFHNGGFKGKIGVIQSLEFKYPLNENDPADIKAANNEHVLQNQFLLDATFRGEYAPDTLECANRLAAVSGGTIEILDEDLEIMREAALYNDYLALTTISAVFEGLRWRERPAPQRYGREGHRSLARQGHWRACEQARHPHHRLGLDHLSRGSVRSARLH